MPTPRRPDPDADLIAAEAELNVALGAWRRLDEAWRSGATPMQRYRTGLEAEAALERVAELEEMIATYRARTPAGAAVKLRRLAARLRDDDTLALLNGALVAIEAG